MIEIFLHEDGRLANFVHIFFLSLHSLSSKNPSGQVSSNEHMLTLQLDQPELQHCLSSSSKHGIMLSIDADSHIKSSLKRFLLSLISAPPIMCAPQNYFAPSSLTTTTKNDPNLPLAPMFLVDEFKIFSLSCRSI